MKKTDSSGLATIVDETPTQTVKSEYDKITANAEIAYITWVLAHAGNPQPEFAYLSDSEKNAWRAVAQKLGS